MPKEPLTPSEPERLAAAEEYMAAAEEHFDALAQMSDPPRQIAFAYYQAGLAVECLLLAYVELTGGEHEAKHDLRRHAANGRFFEQLPAERQEEALAALGDVATRWRNNHRYRSTASLRRFLNAERLYVVSGRQSVKGDVVKHNWLMLAEASTLLLTLGIGRWEISKTKWRR